MELRGYTLRDRPLYYQMRLQRAVLRAAGGGSLVPDVDGLSR